MGDQLIQIARRGRASNGEVSPAPAEHSRLSAASGGKTFFIETFGCQMNVHDSEKVAGVLLERGYRPARSSQEADLILYNTCSIREKAAQKVFSRLGTFKKQRRPGQALGVLGCVAQQEGERIFERAPQVSLVCGSASYARLPELLDEMESGRARVRGLSLETDECFETDLTRRDKPFSAYLTIIEGCDQRCAFCVVPRTRGPERCRSSAAILEECRRLAGEGFGEIQLLGQIVNAWRDPAPARLSFAELLGRVAEIPGVSRVRFTTSHPRYFTPEIVAAIDAHPALCEQIHLPVQSGSDAVLERMGRHTTRADYLEKIRCIRNARRAISISTDLIVGFCGETERDFEATLSLLQAVEYSQVFAFKYSPRPMTRAGAWTDSVPEEEKARRLRELQERQREIQLRHHRALVGGAVEVLVENFQPRLGQAVGRTRSNLTVNFPGSPADLGRTLSVRVVSAGAYSLVGERVAESLSAGPTSTGTSITGSPALGTIPGEGRV